MTFKYTILGSGDTLGTPISGSRSLASKDKSSKRFRFGVLIEVEGQKILIDPNPDLKWQCINSNFQLKDVDHILITHHHSDHVNGLGEFFYRRENATNLWFGDHPLNHKLMEYWKYLELEKVLKFNSFVDFQPFNITKKVSVTPFTLNHGFPASGFIIKCNSKSIAILTDSNIHIPKSSLNALKNIDVLFVDAFSENLNQAKNVYIDCNIEAPDLDKEWYHMTFEDVMNLNKKINAKKVYTIHMSRHLSPHNELVKKYQTESFIIGYDNLVGEL